MVHLITYEFVGVRLPDEAGRLEEAIRSFGECYAFHKTAWFVETNATNKEVCEKLGALLRPRDRLVVTRIHPDWVAVNVPQVEIDWLAQRNFHSPNDPSGQVARFPR